MRAKGLVGAAEAFPQEEWALARKQGLRLLVCYNEQRAERERQKSQEEDGENPAGA